MHRAEAAHRMTHDPAPLARGDGSKLLVDRADDLVGDVVGPAAGRRRVEVVTAEEPVAAVRHDHDHFADFLFCD